MDCVAIMLFTQHVYHLQYIFFFYLFWYVRLLLFQFKSQSVDVYKSGYNIGLKSPKHEEKAFPYAFIYGLMHFPVFVTIASPGDVAE